MASQPATYRQLVLDIGVQIQKDVNASASVRDGQASVTHWPARPTPIPLSMSVGWDSRAKGAEE